MNQLYDNFFLENEIEDQLNSKLNLQQFVTVDNNLVGTPGRKVKINKYSATDSVEKVEMGEGNTDTSESRLNTVEYEIETAQGRFMFYDEEEQIDPIAINKGIVHLAEDMYNTMNGDIYGEYMKATRVVPVEKLDFAAFVDGASMFNAENLEGMDIFAFVAPDDVAALRKELADSLKYVEAYVRAGYVGTVAGINIYTKKDATVGTVAIATKQAVTLFNKTGTEVERPARSTEEANIRQNWVYTRKHYVVALTDEDYAIKLLVGQTAALSEDTSVQEGKTYYAKSGLGYVAVVPAEGDNPVTKGWYEIGVNP